VLPDPEVKQLDSRDMPWQAVPSLLIICGAFNVAAGLMWGAQRLGFGEVRTSPWHLRTFFNMETKKHIYFSACFNRYAVIILVLNYYHEEASYPTLMSLSRL